jgi:divalent metal cation (Fe/Co/Zn/Cd) transporter
MLRRVQRLQILTLVWMFIEVVIALEAAWIARSPALLGFGGDSAVELLSAIIVLWRFCSSSHPAKAERIAARVAGGLLLVVAGFVVVSSALSLLGYHEPEASLVGMILLVAAGIGMPWLASQKRKLAAQVSSAALKADATESALCGYLALIALAGLLVNAIFHLRWADPIAALALAPFIGREGWQTLRAGRHCCECAL